MSSGLAATFDLLATTPNQAAVPVLVAALDAPRQELRDQALDALLRRRSPPAELEILSRWKSLTQRWKTRVADCFGWLSGAIRQSLLHGDSEHYQCACQAAIDTRDYDQIPLLVAAAENKSHPHSPLATATVLELAELLAEELNGPRDYRIRRDPALQRQHVLGSLERTAGQFSQHGRRELIEAFVLLADRENASLKAILQSPNDRSFAPLIEVLVQSSRPAAMRLLLSCLDDAHAPLAALHALALRRDVSFLRHLVRKIGAEPARIVSMNLKRIESIPWVVEQLALLDAFNESEQPGVVQLAVLSAIPRRAAYEVLAYILRHGKVAGRRSAARALADFSGAEANELALRTLRDDDPEVRAIVALQLRDRAVPGAIQHLIDLLDSTHQSEREAAQSRLVEFRFEHYAANFDNLPEEVRKSAGALVRRVDPQALTLLREELDAASRSRRKRGLEMAVALDAVAATHDAIAALLKDEDQFLRADAVRVLASSDAPRTRHVLRDALLDPHPLVSSAAEAALAQLARGQAPSAGGPASSEPASSTAPDLSTVTTQSWDPSWGALAGQGET
jgi:HEAT repeat protein